MSDASFESLENFSGRRLEKLERIRAIFIWPMVVWLGIVGLDLVTYVLGMEHVEPLRKAVELTGYYSFPVILIYTALATFYSSYKILESRGHKNIFVFFLIQMIAAFLVVSVGLKIPSLSKVAAISWTVAIALTVVLSVLLVQRLVTLPAVSEGDLVTSTKLGKPTGRRGRNSYGEAAGMSIAGLFSLVIAAMIYCRVRSGISFVPWGVFFGVIISGIALNSERLILSMLFFLDPRGANNLYQLIKIKEGLEEERQKGEVEVEIGTLRNQERRTKALRMANQLTQELSKVTFERGERRVMNLIESLRQVGNLSQDDEEYRISEAELFIAQLRKSEEIPRMLPEVDYSSLSLGEKLRKQVGLSPEDISNALAEGLIEGSQAFLWKPENQARIRMAGEDFKRNRIRGSNPIYLADSWSDYFETNRFVLDQLAASLANSVANLAPIKGAEEYGLMVFEFSTIASRYWAVVSQAQDSGFLVYGVFEGREKVPERAERVTEA